MVDRALTPDQAALRLGFHAETLKDPEFRRRVGLPAVRIGRSLRFLESDVLRIIEKGRECFPGTTTACGSDG